MSFVYNLLGGTELLQKSGMVGIIQIDNNSYLLPFMTQMDHQEDVYARCTCYLDIDIIEVGHSSSRLRSSRPVHTEGQAGPHEWPLLYIIR